MANSPRKTNAKTVAALRKVIEFHKAEIAKHRDALRDILEDAEAVADSSTDAIDYLESAVDCLSQYV
jgi:hypothetical protein